MIIWHMGTTIVQWRIQQLRRRVSANERIDNQNGFDKKGNLHRTWNVHDSGISVRILKSDMKGARSRECMSCDIDISADVVAHVNLLESIDF